VRYIIRLELHKEPQLESVEKVDDIFGNFPVANYHSLYPWHAVTASSCSIKPGRHVVEISGEAVSFASGGLNGVWSGAPCAVRSRWIPPSRSWMLCSRETTKGLGKFGTVL